MQIILNCPCFCVNLRQWHDERVVMATCAHTSLITQLCRDRSSVFEGSGGPRGEGPLRHRVWSQEIVSKKKPCRFYSGHRVQSTYFSSEWGHFQHSRSHWVILAHSFLEHEFPLTGPTDCLKDLRYWDGKEHLSLFSLIFPLPHPRNRCHFWNHTLIFLFFWKINYLWVIKRHTEYY